MIIFVVFFRIILIKGSHAFVLKWQNFYTIYDAKLFGWMLETNQEQLLSYVIMC